MNDRPEIVVPLDIELLEDSQAEEVAAEAAELVRKAILEIGVIPGAIRLSRDPRICAKCAKGPFPTNVELWPEIRAYARPKSRRQIGSGSSLIGREPTGRWICDSCGSKLAHGLDTGQGRLVP